MVLPPSRRALLLALALLLVAPTSSAQLTPPTPPQVDEPVPKPDLIPGNAHVNATYETEPVDICVEALNVHGDQRTTHGHFDVILHLDGFEEGLRRVTEMLSNGESARVCWKLRLDEGWHRFHFVVDASGEVEEHRENNNIAPQRSFYVRPAPQADLIVEFFDIFPRVANETRPQVFRAIVRNVGDAATDASWMDFVDDTGLLGRLPVKKLVPGERVEVTLITRPELRPAGVFVARAIVDANATIPERNETNNERTVAYEIEEHPLPNLRVRNLTLEGEPVARQLMWLNFTIDNIGDRQMPPGTATRIRIYDDDVPVANDSRPALAPGRSVTVHLHVRMKEGLHDLRVMVDPDNEIAEHDETDNSEHVLVDVAPLSFDPTIPNLVLDRIDAAPNDPRPGETVMLIALVRNPSDVRINETTLEFTINGEPLGTAPTPALAPGRSATVTLSWPATAEGTYTIRARADALAGVAESDEGDNELARTFVVVNPPPPAPPVTPDRNGTEPPPPATPTPPTQQPPAQPPRRDVNATALTIGEVSVTTRPVPGGVKGIAVASLRNPALEPVGRMSVTFRVDGKPVKEVLVEGLGGAATAPVSSGEIDLPAGTHDLDVEVRFLGAAQPTATARKQYEAAAGQEGVPGLPAGAALAVAAALALAMRRKRR